MGLFSDDNQLLYLKRKIPFILFVIGFFIFVVLIRLFYLQVFKTSLYQILSNEVTLRSEELRATRGVISDRNHIPLAKSRNYYQIVLIPQHLSQREKTITSLTRLLPLEEVAIKKKLEELRFQAPFMPIVLVDDAPYDWIATIAQYQRDTYTSNSPYYLEGVEIVSSMLREYLYPEMLSHALGFLTEINKDDLKKMTKKYPGRYSLGDLWAKTGLEGFYDIELRGLDGVKAKVVDARGREVHGNPDLDLLQERGSVAPIAGYDLVTTLDLRAQKMAFEAMGDRSGAVVALDPQTGEILVFYSSPGFDVNRLIRNVDVPYWKLISQSEEKIIYNRAIQGLYAPGSTFKMVASFAALATGKITPDTKLKCGGGLHYGNRVFKCWKGGGHGVVDLHKAIMQSCNVYFYQLGLMLGVDELNRFAGKLGLGLKSGIDLPLEEGGHIPSTQWKLKTFGQKWMEGETLSVVIGQGDDAITPLQNAQMISMIANGGYKIWPHLAKQMIGQNEEIVKIFPDSKGERIIPQEIVEKIQQGLIDVVHGEGTGRRLKVSPNKIAGKTGTAQIIGHGSKVKATQKTKPHGWFIGYAPYDNPKIAIAVLVENGGSGGASAAPVAMAVIDAYLKKSPVTSNQ